MILTGLYNYATPFIRYEIGDYITLADGSGSSGLTLARLGRIEGRRRNALVTADGRRIYAFEATSRGDRVITHGRAEVGA